MADVAVFRVAVPLRCTKPRFGSPVAICGAIAAWEGTAAHGRAGQFFCDAHWQRGDRVLAADVVYRRVSITAEITFAGSSFAPDLAKTEAVERLRGIVEAAGGCLNLHTATTAIGRYQAPAAPYRDPVGAPTPK